MTEVLVNDVSPDGNLDSVAATGSGAMIFDQTPQGPSSTAITRDRVSTPALAEETWAWYGRPSNVS